MLISRELFSLIRFLPSLRRYPELHHRWTTLTPIALNCSSPQNGPLPRSFSSRNLLSSSPPVSHLKPIPLSTIRRLSTSGPLSVHKAMRWKKEPIEGVLETNPEGIPVIRFPTRLSAKLGKAIREKEEMEEQRREDRRRRHDRPLVIACKRPEFNFRLGQPLALQRGRRGYKLHSPKYNPRFLTLLLASQAWAKPKSQGDFFQIRPYLPATGHPALRDSYLHEIPGFDKFPLDPLLLDALRDLNYPASTAIQNDGIPTLLAGENAVLSAETGSGKTLAYVLPTLQRLLNEKVDEGEERKGCPRAVVVVPNRELVDQVFEVVEKVLKYEGTLQVEKRVGGGRYFRKVENAKVGMVDMLIITPGILSRMVADGTYTLSHCQTIILDECDTLLDDSFNHLTRDILARVPLTEGPLTASPSFDGTPDLSTLQQALPSQLILVGATAPKSLSPILDGVASADALVKIKTTHCHRIQPHVLQTFLRLGKLEKPGKLLELVREDVKHGLVTLVFCGTGKIARWTVSFLQENGVTAELMSKEITAGERGRTYRAFRNGGVNVLVGTDIASRGLDTTFVDHVINYDFPRVVSDYIHRGGRVGRLGTGEGRSRGKGQGRITSFVAAKWEVPTVQSIEEAVRRSTEIRNVNANIARVMNARAGVEPLPEVSGKGKVRVEDEERDVHEKLY